MPTPDKGDGRQVKPFAATLQELSGGTVAARLAEQLQELTAAVKETGKKGTLTLQLVVAPLKAGNTDNLLVTAKTLLKAPEDDDRNYTDRATLGGDVRWVVHGIGHAAAKRAAADA